MGVRILRWLGLSILKKFQKLMLRDVSVVWAFEFSEYEHKIGCFELDLETFKQIYQRVPSYG